VIIVAAAKTILIDESNCPKPPIYRPKDIISPAICAGSGRAWPNWLAVGQTCLAELAQRHLLAQENNGIAANGPDMSGLPFIALRC
jgi:hypothetical protein